MQNKEFEKMFNCEISQKLVLLLFDKNQYDKESIENIIEEEDYPFNFLIDSGDLKFKPSSIKEFDEIWTFGFVKDLPSYQTALECGADIWEMG